jgi:alpha-galactosidase
VANRSDEPVAVRSVSLVFRLDGVVSPLRLFRHGYQSWSPTAVATYGIDSDPSRADGVPALVRAMHHADAAPAWPGELRSEAVTVLADASGSLLLAGFVGGTAHDGTWRFRPSASDPDGIELWAEAFLGGAVLAPAERRTLHPVTFEVGERGGAPALLEDWASVTGTAGGARAAAPYQVGWCSWYHYFARVTEADVRANLARSGDWPFEVFQVDDGYQAAIGDWLVCNDRFPSSLDALADTIAAAGRTPGIWLAPFVAAPASDLAARHPEWLARWTDGDRPLVGMVNDAWGGAVHVLDTTSPDVLAHLESVASALVAAGYTYLKLDFTYAPGFDGTFSDPTLTPAQRVRAGFDAIRRGAGDETFILGCGAPLAATVGAVDGMRIGPDVAPWWDVQADQWRPPGYEGGQPATLNAWRNTLARSFLHRRWWLNDPDCLMLRTSETSLTPEAARAWALAVGVSGGMALVSDDLALLDASARALLDEVLDLGRDSDRGGGARCLDLLDAATPGHLTAAGNALVGDPAAATAVVQRALG